jgi:hypothetical protein
VKKPGLPALPEEVVKSLPGWKRKYGKLHIMELAAPGKEPGIIVFRPPTRGEAKAFLRSQSLNAIEAEDDFVEKLRLYPEEYSFDDFTDSDFRKVMEILWGSSPFADPTKFVETLDQKREELFTSVDRLIETYICAAFHQGPEYVDSLTSEEVIEHLASAELILGRELPIELKGQLSKKHPDPRTAREAMKAQRVAKKLADRRRQWRERTGLPPEEAASGPKFVDNKEHEGGPVNTKAENEALFRVRPDLRYHDGGGP